MVSKALVRRPSGRVADGLVTHVERRPVNAERASDQWERYVAALRENGWETVEVPPEEAAPDSVFVEDTVVVYRDVALLARPGAEERRQEVAGTLEVVTGLGYALRRVEAPGTLDGGDVLKVGDTVYVGIGGRTNADGVRQLRSAFEPSGATVVAVPVSRVLHLKSAVTALPDGTVIGHPETAPAVETFPRYLDVPEPEGAHVVLLGGGRLLMAASAPRTAELFTRMGYEPVPVDIGEFEKLEGCVTCLSVRLRNG